MKGGRKGLTGPGHTELYFLLDLGHTGLVFVTGSESYTGLVLLTGPLPDLALSGLIFLTEPGISYWTGVFY